MAKMGADFIERGDMDQETLNQRLQAPLLARLATSRANQPHVVPVWFLWDGESLWISAFTSTRKVRELQANPLCSIVIDVAPSGTENWGVIFEGQADLVTEPLPLVQEMTTRIYTRYLGPEGVLAPDPQSWIHSPENLVIKLAPSKTYSWG